MEKQSYFLIILLIAFLICIGVFWFQFNNDVSTFIILNESEVSQNGSFSGMLMDSYSNGVANQSISFNKPDNSRGIVQTDENGEFTIENVEYLSGADDGNYYGNFTFAGNGKYLGCSYEGNVTVVSN